MAMLMAHGALISGLRISSVMCAVALTGRLASDAKSGHLALQTYIIIRHGPANRQEAKEERPAIRSPSRSIVDVGEDITSGVLGIVVCRCGQDKQSNTAGNDHQSVKDHIPLGDFLHPVGRKRIDQARKHSEGGHHADIFSSSWRVLKIRADRDCC